MTDMFVSPLIEPDSEDHRTCGTCLERKHVSHFYKDGKDSQGNYRYRRDCKDCYRKTRLTERRAKRPAPPPAAKPKGRGRR